MYNKYAFVTFVIKSFIKEMDAVSEITNFIYV